MINHATNYSVSDIDFRRITGRPEDHAALHKICQTSLPEQCQPNPSIISQIDKDPTLKAYFVYCDRIISGLLVYQNEEAPQRKLNIHCLQPVNTEKTAAVAIKRAMFKKVLSDAEERKYTLIQSIVNRQDEEGKSFFRDNLFAAIEPSPEAREVVFTKTISQAPAAEADVSRKRHSETLPEDHLAKKARAEQPPAEKDHAPRHHDYHHHDSYRYTQSRDRERTAPQQAVTRVPQRETRSGPLSVTLKEPYISYIQQGKKTVEGRIASGMFSHISVGSSIRFFNQRNEVTCKVLAVTRYESFEKMLQAEGLNACLPNTYSLADGVRIYNSIPGYTERARQHGVVGIKIERQN